MIAKLDPAEARWNPELFWADLDVVRAARGVTWAEVARQSGVLHSTLNRLAGRNSGNVETIAKLMLWMGNTNVKDYLT